MIVTMTLDANMNPFLASTLANGLLAPLRHVIGPTDCTILRVRLLETFQFVWAQLFRFGRQSSFWFLRFLQQLVIVQVSKGSLQVLWQR